MEQSTYKPIQKKKIRLIALLLALHMLPCEFMGQVSLVKVISVNTLDKIIIVDGLPLDMHNMEDITLKLGKPDRVLADSAIGHMEVMSYGGGQPHSRAVSVFSRYYIYDGLGLMFYNNAKRYKDPQPEWFSIHFQNKRTFDNREPPKYLPKQAFKGQLLINGDTLDVRKTFVPNGVDYDTREFEAHGASFGPMSYGGVIDGLYSLKTDLYVEVYLDNGKMGRVSYVLLNVVD